ncbi:hypothetical protein AKO1_007691 [Acrasis kona]|uniref:Uncharacterized protein n=1 Tax=Acrasis kona TaxID=1008807 RepID=A0AAW2YQ20_9EUKA
MKNLSALVFTLAVLLALCSLSSATGFGLGSKTNKKKDEGGPIRKIAEKRAEAVDVFANQRMKEGRSKSQARPNTRESSRDQTKDRLPAYEGYEQRIAREARELEHTNRVNTANQLYKFDRLRAEYEEGQRQDKEQEEQLEQKRYSSSKLVNEVKVNKHSVKNSLK